jgi:hypothetical protein
MKKIIATIAATGLLLVGGASTASAETLYRNGAKKVTINPAGAPAGAVVTKAKVTVKKGKKTVARNKNFYKAKKGKYKVTSTITYIPTFTRPMTQQDSGTAYCLVTSHAVVSHQTTFVSDGDGWGKVTGPATIRYTGTCTVDFYPSEAWDGEQVVTYDTAWTEDVTVWDYVRTAHNRTAVILDHGADVNTWAYAYSSLESYPTLTFHSSPWEKVAKSTRTVVVR